LVKKFFGKKRWRSGAQKGKKVGGYLQGGKKKTRGDFLGVWGKNGTCFLVRGKKDDDYEVGGGARKVSRKKTVTWGSEKGGGGRAAGGREKNKACA